MQENKTVKL